MAEYISRDAVLKQLSEAESNGVVPLGHYEQRHSDFEEAKRCIEDISAADVQPVKRGRWKENAGYGGWGDTIYQCSECNIEFTCETGIDIDWNYCPHCGARMDLKDGDAE